MKLTTADYIRMDPTIEGPYVLVTINRHFHLGLWEVRGQAGEQHAGWFVTFNGNSKQRRQQQRKLLRDLNK